MAKIINDSSAKSQYIGPSMSVTVVLVIMWEEERVRR